MKASSFPKEYRVFNLDTGEMLYEKELNEKGFSLSPEGLPVCAKENLLNVVINWYTGRKDDHGKKLYESDICKVEVPNEYGSVSIDYGIMVWNNNLGQFMMAIPSVQGGIEVHVRNVTLVGNEFENQELISLVKNQTNG